MRGDEPVQLSPRAISILTTLVERHDRVVTKDEIFAEVWPGIFVEENNLTVHVSALRKALGPGAIVTIPGRGYRFVAEIEQAATELAEPEPAPYAAEPAAPVTNLPQRLNSVIGREVELAELSDRLGEHRLVTLVGPSGIGKTRLAIELGWRLADSYADGVWLVDLAPLTDPGVVSSAAATALGVALRGAEAPVETIATALAKQRRLLVFDNCEHLIDAAAGLIETLLARVPDLTVLATSQETLRVTAEQVYRLNPLALPPPSATAIEGFGAVGLFVERARAADRRFGLDEDNAAAVVEICRRLDGIPLALEMAAARLPLLGIEGLRSRLDERLHMLSTGPRTAEWRHRTLRDTVAWSYGLLDPSDQKLFRRLAGFAGSFTLDAAIAVAGEPGADHWETVDALGRLVDKSLVTVEGDEQPRYRLLETLRLYAAERLAAAAETAAVAERHARYYTELFDRAYEAWETTPDAAWLAVYRPEIDNVRAALDWALADKTRAKIAAALAGSAALLWDKLSLLAEGRQYADRALRLVDQNQLTAVTARLLKQVGILWHSSDRLQALASLEKAAEIYRLSVDRPNLGSTLCTIGSILAVLGRHAEAKAPLLEAWETLSESNWMKSQFNILNSLGILALFTGQNDEARVYLSRALACAKAQHDVIRQTQVLVNLAEVEFDLDNVDRAVAFGHEAVTQLRSVGKRSYLGWGLVNLASYLIAQDNVLEASKVALEGLWIVREEGGFIVRVCLQQWALLSAIRGHCTDAGRLLGFVDSRYSSAGEERQPTELKIYNRIIAKLRLALTSDEIELYAREGSRWNEEEAVRFVLRHIEQQPTRDAAVG